MSKIETTILANLIHNSEYSQKVLPFIKREYFKERPEIIVTEEILSFVDSFNKLPTQEILSIQASNRHDINDQTLVEVEDLIRSLDNHPTNDDWLLDETEKFCKNRAVFNAIISSMQIIDGKDKKYTQEAIPTLLSDALSICFDTNVGHDFFEDSESRFEYYRRVEEKIPFDIDILNKITNGGLARKSLNILLAGTGVGKSLVMCHFAAAALMQSKNVLYITMEMAEERIAERIDANLLNLGMSELKTVEQNIFSSRVNNLKVFMH